MATHAVIGTGNAPSKVVMDGLAEAIEDGDKLSLVWEGSPEDGSAIESVYAFVKDSETPTVVFHADEQNVPQALRSWDNVSVVKTRHPLTSALDSVADGGAVLFLWNDDAPDEIHAVYDHSESHNIMELSNGLCPIVLGDDSPLPPPPAPEPTSYSSKAPELLSIDELEVMTAAAVKQYGQDMGCESKTKSGIIEEIAARLETAVPAEPETSPAEPSNNEVTFEQELIALLGDFFQQYKSGFESDMAHLALGQARLWMLRALDR